MTIIGPRYRPDTCSALLPPCSFSDAYSWSSSPASRTSTCLSSGPNSQGYYGNTHIYSFGLQVYPRKCWPHYGPKQFKDASSRIFHFYCHVFPSLPNLISAWRRRTLVYLRSSSQCSLQTNIQYLLWWWEGGTDDQWDTQSRYPT